MQANNLTICVPFKGCDMKDKCQNFCVSKMTGYMKTSDIEYMKRNFDKVKHIAQTAGVTSVLITGKGEPTINAYALDIIMKAFDYYPIELQTNGIVLSKNLSYLHNLKYNGLDVLAISINTLQDFEDFKELFKHAQDLNITTRATLNISWLIPDDISFKKILRVVKQTGNIDQFSLRQIVAPLHVPKKKLIERLRLLQPVISELYSRLIDELKKEVDNRGFKIRSLPYGAQVYDLDNLSVTYFNYCVQDSNKNDDIRSLIFQEDGHLYTSWNSKASRLF